MFCVSLYSQPVFYLNDNNAIDLDTLYPKKHEFEFYVKNTGNELLEIEKLGASCGCTVFELENYEIPPQDSSKLTIKYDLHKYSGERTNHLFFETNDPELKKFRIPIRMYVYRDLVVTPKKLPIKFNISPEENVEYKFSITNNSNKEIRIKQLVADDQNRFKIIEFTGENKILRQGETLDCILKIKYSKDAGFVGTKLKIPTTSEIIPVIEMQLLASMRE